VKFYDFASNMSRDVYKIEKRVFAGLTVSPAFPDGHRRLLFTQIDRMGSDLMLVEHFR